MNSLAEGLERFRCREEAPATVLTSARLPTLSTRMPGSVTLDQPRDLGSTLCGLASSPAAFSPGQIRSRTWRCVAPGPGPQGRGAVTHVPTPSAPKASYERIRIRATGQCSQASALVRP